MASKRQRLDDGSAAAIAGGDDDARVVATASDAATVGSSAAAGDARGSDAAPAGGEAAAGCGAAVPAPGADPAADADADIDWSRPQVGAFVSRDELAKQDEDNNILEFRLIWNDGQPQNFIWLITLKNIIAQQLPKMPREYIVRLVLDRRHRSMVIVQKATNQVMGGVCYRPFTEQRFAEIAFFAISSSFQVRGFGTRLMNHLKEAVKKDGITHFVTYADNYAVGYFQKQGFTMGFTMPKERWEGYIKDYDGGTLMECEIHPEVNYLDIPGMVRRQRKVLVSHIRAHGHVNKVYPCLERRCLGRFAIPVATVPGVAEAGWTDAAHEAQKKESDAEALQSQLMAVTQAIVSHSESWPFREPVNKDEAEDYYDVVLDPIDLKLVQQRVSAGYYVTADMYLADLRLMLSNCRLYNLPTTQFVACANKLEAFINQKMRGVSGLSLCK